MHKYIQTVHTDRSVKYHDVEHDIFDEDFIKDVTWCFGLFKTRRTFKLRNDMSGIIKSEVKGFKNK
jgi:hypothetical protein